MRVRRDSEKLGVMCPYGSSGASRIRVQGWVRLARILEGVEILSTYSNREANL